MKTLLQAVGMAVVLFVYGYSLSVVGHDHSSHEINSSDQHSMRESHDHHDHTHE